MLSPFHGQCQNGQVGCHVRSYRIYDLLPIPDSLIPVFKAVHGQIEFMCCPPQVLVRLYKDGCAKFYRPVGCVIVRINRGASFEEISLAKAEGNHIKSVAYGPLRSRCAQKCRQRHQGHNALSP